MDLCVHCHVVLQICAQFLDFSSPVPGFGALLLYNVFSPFTSCILYRMSMSNYTLGNQFVLHHFTLKVT